MIHIDFETRSRADIRKTGSHRYASDPSTEVLCLAYNLTGKPGETELWVQGEEPPEDLINEINIGSPICAHNAAFERAIWTHICHERFGWAEVAPDQWRCTLAGCSRQGLPRSLAAAGAALGISMPKDQEGRKIMLQLCKPDRAGNWVETPDKLERLYEYCIRDVEAEIAIWDKLEEMPESELKIWHLDQEINFRGLQIDVGTAKQFLTIVESYREKLSRELVDLTNGAISSAGQVMALKTWLKEKGVSLPDLQKATVEEALTQGMDSDAERVLELRQQLSAASTGKIEAMISRAEDDDRVRGNLVYHGAATGRWAGTGLQIQNFPRGSMSPAEVDFARDLLPHGPDALEIILGNPIEVAKSSLRSLIKAAPGKSLFVCDYASIEARVLAWISRQDDLVQDFRDGADVYVSMASAIYGNKPEEVEKNQRLVGKIAILGLGYGMGGPTFKRTCSTWNVPCKFSFARRVVAAYRNKHDKIKQFWTDIDRACLHSVRERTSMDVGRLTVVSDEKWMRIVLPSGREIMYAKPLIQEVTAPWSKGYTGDIIWDGDEDELFDAGVTWDDVEANKYIGCKFTNLKWLQKNQNKVENLEKMEPQMIDQISYKSVVGQSRKWARTQTYGGKLTENIVQAIARDFLAEAMLRVDEEYPISATIHDEIVSETDSQKSLERFEELMEVVPPWGQGCPIAVEGYKAKRYRK